ncbi:MAG: carboxypeptidase regulatory-like domain-containing protein [Deltaproteobacteria bacterium]|nr:carboxypeptidase regulatory-like domain-containing protein [Deltaproteobacteria bacterium]
MVTLLFLPAAEASAEQALGRVTGRIDCQSVAGCPGVAALWPADKKIVPAPDRYVLVPALMSALQPDGSFELIAPVGEYYIGVQLRKTPGPLFGSPRVGDQIYLMQKQDETGYRVTVKKDQVTDIGLHSKAWTFAGLTTLPEMGVRGQVIDINKHPVAGLLVFAFADPGARTTPLAVSSRTGKDGSFVLPLATSGAVYLRARKNYRGGKPELNDYIGAAENAPQPVVVAPGRLTTEVIISVRKLSSVLRRKNAPGPTSPKPGKR